MINKLIKTFEKLNLIQNKDTSEQDYAWQPDAKHDFDLVRFLNNQAYWKINQGPKEPRKKKIVLNDYRLLFNGEMPLYYETLQFLFQHGYQFYIRIAPGKFEVIDDFKKLTRSHIYKTALADNETIFNELQAINEKPEDFFILDHESHLPIYQALVPFMGTIELAIAKSLRKFDRKKISFNAWNTLLLTENNINYLSKITGDKSFTSVSVLKKHSYKEQQMRLSWKLTTDEAKNRQLLQQIKNGFDPTAQERVLPYPSSSYLQLVQGYVTDVDLTKFNALENLEIFQSDELVNIDGFYKHKNLKNLSLHIMNDINYKFGNFRKLESLDIIYHPEYDLQYMLEHCTVDKLSLELQQAKPKLDGLSACKNLKELVLRDDYDVYGLSNIKNIQLPALKTLKKLILRAQKWGGLNNLVVDFDNENVPLEEIHIESNSSNAITLPKQIKTLKKLYINSASMPELQKILNGCPALEELCLNGVRDFDELDLSSLKNLRSLEIKQCDPINTITGLNECQKLETINISTYKTLKKELDLTTLSKLKNINLSCYHTEIKLPARPDAIESLELEESTISELDCVHYINLSNLVICSSNMKEVKNLSACKHLKSLYIFGIDVRFLEMSNHNLDRVIIKECSKLESIKGLEDLNLVKLNIMDCPKLNLERFDVHSISDCRVLTKNFNFPWSLSSFSDYDIFFDDTASVEDRNLKPLPITSCNQSLLKEQQNRVSRKRVRNYLPSYNTSNSDSYRKYSYDDTIIAEKSAPKRFKIADGTYVSPDTEVTVMKIFSDSEHFKPLVDNYRKTIYDHFDYDWSNGLSLGQPDVIASLEPYVLKPAKAIEPSVGFLKCTISPGEYFILPGLSAHDDLMDLIPKELFDIYKSKITNQYAIKLKPDCRYPINCDLKYTVNADKNYFKLNSTLDMKVSVPELPERLKYKLAKLFSTNAELNSISRLETNEDKIAALKKYCMFDNDELSDPFNIDDINHFVLMLKERKGNCAHSSSAFMALCHYLKIPARMVTSDCHAFVEIPIYSPKGTQWKAIYVGGSAVKLTVIDPLMPYEIFLNDKMDIDNPLEPTTAQNIDLDYDEALLPYFIPNEAYLSGCKTVSDAIHKLLLQDKAILFRTQSSADVWQYYHALYHFYKAQDLPFVLIDSVDDLKALFAPVQIHATGEQRDKLYSRVEGPIKQLIQGERGAILINWENFSAHDKALYKSLVDDPPTLNGISIAKNIRVFGVLPHNIKANSVFCSRLFTVKMPADLIEEEKGINTQASPPLMTQNLYHGSDWKSVLIHEFIPQGDVMQIKQGELLTAMKDGCSIELVNPPHDRDFYRTIERVQTEGKLFVNGQWIYAKPGFKVSMREVPIAYNIPPSFSFEDHQATQGKYYHITPDNFSCLFKQYHVDSNGRIYLVDGWLKEITSQDQMVITAPLSAEQWQKLFDQLNAEHNTKKLHVYCLPNCAPENHDNINEAQPVSPDYKIDDLTSLVAKNTNLHLRSNDVELVTHQLQQICKLPSDNIVYLTDDNAWSNLIETMTPEIVNHRLRAKRTKSVIWEKLKKGETIVLSGNLSDQDYHSLQTLFINPPYLYVNGKRKAVAGRLLWVENVKRAYDNPLTSTYPIAANLEDYTHTLRHSIENVDDAIIARLNHYFKCLSEIKPSDNEPKIEVYNYAKYKQMYAALCQSTQAQNPLKHITQYFYRKDTQSYAHLNVLAKVLLSDNNECFINKERLLKILSNIHSQDDFHAQLWRIVDCFSSHICRQLIGNIQTWNMQEQSAVILREILHLYPLLSQQAWVQAAIPTANQMEMDVPNKVHIQKSLKQKQALLEAINDRKQPVIYLFGESGTGKTYTVKKLCKRLPYVDFYVGENKVADWLKPSTNDKIKVLLLDEANLSPEAHWEYLQGLCQNPPVVNYRGHSYPLSEKHKIALTGNPLFYPDRHFQPLVWDHAKVIWFSPFEANFVKHKIAKYLKRIDNTFCQQNNIQLISELVYNSYHYLEQTDQRVAEVTLRDIENICARFILFQRKHNSSAHETDIRNNLADAIYTELSSVLLNKEARDQFKAYLQQNCGILPEVQPQHFKDKDFIIPPSKEKLWSLVCDELALRQMRIDLGRNSPGKLGLLLQGPSGVGKTKIYLKALQSLGFSYMPYPVPADRQLYNSQKIYYQITAGSENTREILLKAFHEGSVVVLDELNLEPELEDLLNQLLSGVDLDDQPARVPGFMVLASQNPAHYDGCNSLSRAFRNRFHEQDVKDYKKEDLLYIAHEKQVPSPTKVIGTFFYTEKLYPDEVNTRNCFNVMDAIKVTA